MVQRIFREYIGGRGDKAIAEGLNRDGILCPSAHRPEQNRHRAGDGWQAPTVAAILQNPRYTGYAVFGRWTKREELIDPDDVAAGYAIRFVRASADRIIRSRRPAHPHIVSVEQFTEAHLIRRGRAGINNRDRAKLERTRTLIPRQYLLRGHIRCDACNRKMQAEIVGQNIYYRCRARTLAPGSDALADHPKTVNLRESVLIDPLDGWLSTLFDRKHRNQTIEILLEAQEGDDTDTVRALLRRRIIDADTRLQRHLAAIEAGVDPAAFVASMNTAQAEKAAARAELDAIPKPIRLTETELHKLVDSVGDIRAVLKAGAPERVQAVTPRRGPGAKPAGRGVGDPQI
ncbi:hypothetical protein AW168_32940 [Nocardia brasiliensis]|nr:hypothetical protein AW168_32940 [Nocardia brasiliensis]